MQRPSLISAEAAEALLVGALTATRDGTLGDYLRQRRLTTRWFASRHLRPVIGTCGDLLPAESKHVEATTLLLRWAASRLRPDHAELGASLDEATWLERTSWRPFLALACHFGLIAVRRFDARYYRNASESPAENLCGLWNVGPSTFYRYLDKARRAMIDVLRQQAVQAEDGVLLREFVHAELGRRHWEGIGEQQRRAWHLRQASQRSSERDANSALWHALQASDAPVFVQTLRRYRIELAKLAETDSLIERLGRLSLTPRQRFDLHLAEAALWRTRNGRDREYRAYEFALRHATQEGDNLLLGIVYGSMGWFHESRDIDRALACFEESAGFLRVAEQDRSAHSSSEASAEYVSSLVRLAWLYVLRNDPRSRTVLDLAEERRGTPGLHGEQTAMLDQAWGEYWRRAGDARLAISFKHKALNAFERLGDTRQTLSTYNNLSLLHIETKEYGRAIEYARRVVAAADSAPVDPYLLTSALGNIGIAYFWLERFDEAIDMYRLGLSQAEKAGLRVIANRAHFNLAEAHFKRFRINADKADETAGDHHLAIVLMAPEAERDGWSQDAAPGLKTEVLGVADGHRHERLLPEESSAHFEQMKEVQRQRALLAVPGSPADHARAHLAIAQAYVEISGREREAALALIQRHGLGSAFETEIDALGMTFSRGLTRERSLMAQWKQKCYGVLTEQRIAPVLHQVMTIGSINKSGYADLCQVGLATASKHLGTLVERGLLVQTGKGPSTRYVLP